MDARNVKIPGAKGQGGRRNDPRSGALYPRIEASPPLRRTPRGEDAAKGDPSKSADSPALLYFRKGEREMDDRQADQPRKTGRTKKIPEKAKKAFVADYFETWDRVEDVAKRHGIGRTAAYEILRTHKYVDRFLDASQAVQARTKIYVNMQAERAARKQAEIMDRELPDHLLYLVQNAARDILDRAGIREQSEGKQDIHITFGDGMPETGMPESAEGEPDEGTDAGGE